MPIGCKLIDLVPIEAVFIANEMLCDDSYYIKDGRVAEAGTHDEL